MALVVGTTALESHAHAQAEAAPEGYEPPPGVPISAEPEKIAAERENDRHRWILAVDPRLVVALGTPAGLPRIGYGIGINIGRALLVRGRFRAGLGVGFSFERVQQSRVPPEGIPYNGDIVQGLSHFGFSLDLRFDGIVADGRVRPWVSIGPAFSVGDYVDPPNNTDMNGVERAAVVAALRAGIGVAVRVWGNVELGPRFEWLATFGGPSVGVDHVAVFQPGNFSVGLDVGYRF